MYDTDNDLLLEALTSLRTLRVSEHTDPQAEVALRIHRLLLAVAALNELHSRDEDLDPEALTDEIERLDTGPFAVDPNLLHELLAGFEADGDRENATTVANAISWLHHKMDA